MKNAHELKGYYETLIKNYKKLYKYIETCKLNGTQANEQDNMHRNLGIIKDKINDFNNLYGAYIRKRRNSFGKFNIDAFINHIHGNKIEKRTKLKRIYDNVENSLDVELKKTNVQEVVSKHSDNNNFYNPGNFFMEHDESRGGKRRDLGEKGYKIPKINNIRGDVKQADIVDGQNSYPGMYNIYYGNNGPQSYINNEVNCGYNMLDPYNDLNNLRNYAGRDCEPMQTNHYAMISRNSPRPANKNNDSGFQNSNEVQYHSPYMFQYNEDSNKKGSSDTNSTSKQDKPVVTSKQNDDEQEFSMLESNYVFKHSDEKEGQSNETVSKIESILGDVKLSEKTKMFIKEMCDVIIESVCNTSCMIAKNSNRDYLEEDDIKLAFKMEYNISFSDVLTKFKVSEIDAEHEKKLGLIEKEKKRRFKL